MLGLGLSVSAPAVLAVSGYHPMRDPLLAERWAANRPDLLTLGSGLVSEARGAKTGLALVQSTASFRPAWDAKAFGGWQNLSLTRSAGVDLSGASALNGAVITRVSIADLPAAVRAQFEADLADDPKLAAVIQVMKVVVPGAVASEGIALAGSVLNGETAITAVRAYAEHGNWNVNTYNGDIAGGGPVVEKHFRRLIGGPFVASGGGRTTLIRTPSAQPGTVYVCLHEMYRRSTLPPNTVLVNAAAAWDFGKPAFILDGTDDYMRSVGVGPLPTGADACHVVLVQENMAPASDQTVRRAIQWGGSTTATARLVGRVSNAGVQNRASAYTGDGVSSVSATTVTGLNDGRRVIDAIFKADGLLVGIDGGALASNTVAVATGVNNVTLGAASQGTAVGFHQGHIASLDVFRGEPTTEQRAARIAWALKEAA